MQEVYCRWAPSLGSLEGSHQSVWGTKTYSPKHRDDPTVFFGLYDLRDYVALARHRGKKWVLWAGSDLRNLDSGFLFNDGKLGLLSRTFPGIGGGMIKRALLKAEHYVENDWEAGVLRRNGIPVAGVVPSFMGDVKAFDIHFKPVNQSITKVTRIYASCNEGREKEYGFDIIEYVAEGLPDCFFHLFGSSKYSQGPMGTHHNIICHGRVPKEEMNEAIKSMHCGLRLNESDGFSEITAKSILMGQYPITRHKYPYISNFDTIEDLSREIKSLRYLSEPNLNGRSYYRRILNNYPWNVKEHRTA